MSEVCNELFLTENTLSKTHALLKHELKTGILAQIRVLEYIFMKFRESGDSELLKLLELSYETSLLQYKTITKEIILLESLNLDNDLCLT